MPTLHDYAPIEVLNFRHRLQEDLKDCPHLQAAAQQCTRLLYGEFSASIVLARIFVTIPYGKLPPRDRQFVANLTEAQGIAPRLQEKTLILSLLGTSGVRPDWNDRYASQGHLGIPLVTADFVDSIPMVSRLMSDMGIGLDWLNEADTAIAVKNLGQIAGVFYVRDASSWLDERNRQIVPAQDFVAAHGVKTVFGLGGNYPASGFLTMIVFARETIEQFQVEGFMPLVNTFKIATMSLALRGAIFG